MKIAITGGAGFVGRNLAHSLLDDGHEVSLITRSMPKVGNVIADAPRGNVHAVGLDDEEKLAHAFMGCEAVVHCAGINREIGVQTYECVHVEGTRHVVNAARHSRVRKVIFLSFLRARPHCSSAYHESKWEAEEIVRNSGLDYTVIKAGVIYGKGDHMLDHLSLAFHTFPIFALVGMRDQRVRPLAVEDMVRVLRACVLEGCLSRRTVAITGPEEMTLRESVKRVARVVDKRPFMIRLPILVHHILAFIFERTMKVPLVSSAQLRILSESVVEPLPACDTLPSDLAPILPFTQQQIRKGVPVARRFGLNDCLCCSRAGAM